MALLTGRCRPTAGATAVSRLLGVVQLDPCRSAEARIEWKLISAPLTRRVADCPLHNMSADPRFLMPVTVLALWLFPCTAYAYIDPNAGGMLFQLLAPVFAAAVGAWLFLRRWIAEAVRNLWHRLTGRRSE